MRNAFQLRRHNTFIRAFKERKYRLQGPTGRSGSKRQSQFSHFKMPSHPQAHKVTNGQYTHLKVDNPHNFDLTCNTVTDPHGPVHPHNGHLNPPNEDYTRDTCDAKSPQARSASIPYPLTALQGLPSRTALSLVSTSHVHTPSQIL